MGYRTDRKRGSGIGGFRGRFLLLLLLCGLSLAGGEPRTLYTAGGSRVLAVLTPIATVALIAVCTAYLIDGSFNPFVYFRF